MNQSGLGRAAGIGRFVALAHSEGCGFGGETMYHTLYRNYRGYATHPNVAAALLLEHGCEKIPNDAMRRQFEAANLPLEHGRIPEPVPACGLDQLVVGDAAPEKEREARRQLEVAETVGATDRQLRRLTLDAEHELRTGQHTLQCDLDATVEVALSTTLAPEIHQPIDVGVAPLSAVRATYERRDDLPGAPFLRPRRR